MIAFLFTFLLMIASTTAFVKYPAHAVSTQKISCLPPFNVGLSMDRLRSSWSPHQTTVIEAPRTITVTPSKRHLAQEALLVDDDQEDEIDQDDYGFHDEQEKDDFLTLPIRYVAEAIEQGLSPLDRDPDEVSAKPLRLPKKRNAMFNRAKEETLFE